MFCFLFTPVVWVLFLPHRHVPKGGGRGGGRMPPPQILADQEAPPAAAVRRLASRPPQFFRLWHMPGYSLLICFFKLDKWRKSGLNGKWRIIQKEISI